MRKEGEGVYFSDKTGRRVRIAAVELRSGTTLEQFAESVRDGLRGDWWTDTSLFEIDSFERIRLGDVDAYSIAYRVQRSAMSCARDVVEVVAVASSLPGNPVGFRARYELCNWDTRRFSESRARQLGTFRIVTRPADYYTQFVHTEDGIIVKASDKVAPEALVKAADAISLMTLAIRNDIRACLRKKGAAMAIYPEGEYVTVLPEFARLKGKMTKVGTPFESSTIGVGASKGQPVSATFEKDLLYFNKFYPFPDVTIHEFAHAVMNLCFTWRDAEAWSALHAAALEANVFPGTYAMTDEDEFFAETSVAYFSAEDIGLGIHPSRIRDLVRTTLPETFAFLERIYGEAPAPPAPVTFHQVTNRDGKYAYSIELPYDRNDWRREREGVYFSDRRAGNIVIAADELGSETTLEQFADSVRDELRADWASAPLFEITSFEKKQLGDLNAYSITYRIEESPEYCIEEIVELVVVASSLPGNPVGFRVRYRLCDWKTRTFLDEFRARALDSFRVFEK